jgi:hypothetical protein
MGMCYPSAVPDISDPVTNEAWVELWRMERQSGCRVPFKFVKEVLASIKKRIEMLDDCVPGAD